MKEASFGLVWYDHCIDVNLWILLFRSRVGHLDETWGRGRKHEEWVLSSTRTGDESNNEKQTLPGLEFVVVQLLSCVQLFVTSWAAARQASLSFTISRSLLKLMSMESMKAHTIIAIWILSKLIEWWHHFSRFVPSFLRLGSWNVIMFVCFEQLKRELMKSRQTMDCAT